MSMVPAPIPTFYEADGDPLESGYIYIGTANMDARTNQIQVYWDEALTVTATQPIRTLGGYPVYQGAPAQLFVSPSSYSIAILDKNQAVIIPSITANWSFITAADLASTASGKGAALVSFIQSGAGAVARTALTKMREIITPEDFGEGLDWDDDWAPAFAAASVRAGPGGTIHANGRYTFLTEPYIQPGVSVVGPYMQPDQINMALGGDYDAKNGVIFIGSAAGLSDGLNVNASCGWEGFIIMRQGLDLPFADATAATAGVAAFAGTAFNVAGNGATFRHLLILGFNKAIYSTTQDRTRIEYVSGDCTNGIEIVGAFDIPDVTGCHFWPFTTVHQSWTTNALLRRTGTAYKGSSTNDWMRWVSCFSYGYARGFYCTGVASNTFLLCQADNTSTAGVGDHAGSIGFVVDGSCEEPRWIGCQAAAQDYGYYYSNNAGFHGTFIDCDAWASAVASLTINSGDATILSGTLRDSVYGVTMNSASSKVVVDFVRFYDIGTKPIHPQVTVTKLRIGEHNDYGNWADGSAIATDTHTLPSIPSNDPLVLPVDGDTFLVTGTTNVGNISGMWAGRKVTLKFTGSLTVNDGGASLLLAGNLVTGGNAVLNLTGVSATVAFETSRAVL